MTPKPVATTPSSSKIGSTGGLPPIADQIHSAADLTAYGLRLLPPMERWDKGAMKYGSVPEAIKNWAADPYGKAKLEFISAAYGISKNNLHQVLIEAGLENYLDHKASGRMVGMVSAQILRPTYYLMANALALAELSRRGIPTAMMVSEYPQDRFEVKNPDKRYAFGKVELPLGKVQVSKEREELLTVQLKLQPYGIRHDDGAIVRIGKLQDANGYRCEQVLVRVADARIKGTSYSTVYYHEQDFSPDYTKTIRVFSEAVLGMKIAGLVEDHRMNGKSEFIDVMETPEVISVTDFYRVLWKQTIETLRGTGDLPTEAEMPMFFVDAQHMYTTLAAHARPSAEALDIMALSTPQRVLREVLHLSPVSAGTILSIDGAYSAYLESRGLRQAENGLLLRSNGMMDPASFYPAQAAWPDLYLECSSCGGHYLVERLRRAQMVRHFFGLPESQVRVPDIEVHELEAFMIHPTGKVLVGGERSAQAIELIAELRSLTNSPLHNSASNSTDSELRRSARRRHRQLMAEIAAARATESAHLNTKMVAMDDFKIYRAFVPGVIASVYRKMFVEEIDDAVLDVVSRATSQVCRENTSI